MTDPWVRSAEELQAMVAELEGSRAIALDTEADSLHHHFAKVCLIQLASDRGRAWLIDPLAFDDLAPLGPLLGDPEILTVLHGADYDVTILKRDFGFEIGNLFDTMLAARFLGWPEIGLQAVARRELGIELSKGNQRDDWSRRPLTARQETYALADVEHLLALQAGVSERLDTLGRMDWVRDESAAVASLPPARRGSAPDAYLKIRGARRLSRRALGLLRELCAWRETVAARTDTPAFKILGNEALLDLTREAPPSVAALKRRHRLPPRARRHVADIVAAVKRGLELSEEELPEFPRSRRPSVSRVTQHRIGALREWRTEEAGALDVDVSVVLPQRVLERIAAAAPARPEELSDVEGLRRWRIEAFGEKMLRVLEDGGRG